MMQSPEHEGWWRPAVIVALAVVVSGVVTYWRSTWMVYARADDYAYIYQTRVGGLADYYQFNLDSGRPIPGWIMTSIIPGAERIADLGMLRLITVVLVALSGAAVATLFLMLTRDRPGWTRNLSAFGVGLVPLTTTAAPNAVTWAILAAAISAFVVAILAGILVLWDSRWWWAPSLCLVLFVAFSYQQMVPLVVLPGLLVCGVAFARREKMPILRTLLVGVMGIAALGLNAWLVLSRDGVGAARLGEATTEQRIDWFVHQFLPLTVDLWLPSTPSTMKLSILIALVAGLSPLLLGWRFVSLPLAGFLAYAGAAAMVFQLELWATYRLASPAQFALWVSVAFCVGYTAVHLKWRPVGVTLAVAGVLCGLFGLSVSRLRAEEYLAKPNVEDLRDAVCFVKRHPTLGPDTPIAADSFGNTPSKVLLADEYGSVSTAVPWAMEFQLWLLLDNFDGDSSSPPFGSGELDIELPSVPPDPKRLVFPIHPCQSQR